jgi:hypothetical protein
VTGRTGGSEDFYALEVDAWMTELAEQAEELKGDLGLLKPENLTHSAARADEFPRVSEGGRPVSEKAAVTLVPDPDWPTCGVCVSRTAN